MELFKNLSRQKLEEELTPEMLKPLQIIFLALTSGIIIFFLIVLYVFLNNSPDESQMYYDTEVDNILLITFVVFFIVIMFMSKIFPEKLFEAGNEQSENILKTDDSDVKKAVSILTTYFIIRLSMMEGVTLFGLIILLITALSGALHVNLIYWIGIIPMFIFIGFSISSFPTKEKIIRFIIEKGTDK